MISVAHAAGAAEVTPGAALTLIYALNPLDARLFDLLQTRPQNDSMQ
jgi:hypothetical protein